MNLNRRSLFASAVALFVASKAKRVAAAIGEHLPWKKKVVSLGVGGDCQSMSDAMKHVESGGMVVLMPGHYECVSGDWKAIS